MFDGLDMATSEGGLMEMELCDVGSTSDGMVRRVPSFMNLDEDFSSMPVFGMTPLLDKTDETPKFVDEVIVSPSHNSVEESDDNFSCRRLSLPRHRPQHFIMA